MLTVGYLLLPLVAAAQDITNILDNILNTAKTIITILFVLATLVFLWGIVSFIAGAGDPSKRDKSKGIMMWGIIGLAVMAAAWGVAQILIVYFGAQTSPPFVPIPRPF